MKPDVFAAVLTRLRDQFEDTQPEHFCLGVLLCAVKRGRVAEVEAALGPVVDGWLAEDEGEGTS